MNTLLLVLFGLALITVLIVSIVRTVGRLRADRGTPAPERTPQQREHDSRTAVIWGVVLVVIIGGLCLAYMLSRGM